MEFMKTYQVRISASAEADFCDLVLFLLKNMSIEGTHRYITAMRNEIMSLSILADLYRTSSFADVLCYHAKARKMVSHNKKWVYIFHIDGDAVVVDRIRPAKLITN